MFVIEFKVGEQKYYRSDIEQVWDYALDLKNFHEPSHKALTVPILIATEAKNSFLEIEIPDKRLQGTFDKSKTRYGNSYTRRKFR